ncbi:MAG: hypothetical protein LBU87_05225 [Lactobacillales bacterium]|jgi:hypothetical protein|nr:hypothetical protein [Lactobacillales bacterium]
MLKLSVKKVPYELDISHGVKVTVRPCTSSVFYEAKAFMNSRIAEAAKNFKNAQEVGKTDPDSPDLNDPIKREAFADQMLIIGLAIAGITDWSGILEADSDAKAPVTPEKIEELFSNFWLLAENFRQQYCGFQEILEAEKNVSTPAPDGTSVTGEVIAKGADKKKSAAPSGSADI